MAKDPLIARYFKGHGESSKKKLRQLQVDMICEATGGPCYYTGRDMKTVHKGMGIEGADWAAIITHLVEVLNSLKVPDLEQKEVLGLINGLKNDIVEKP